MTERARFVFTIKESGDGTPWIAAEPSDEAATKLLDGKNLGFDLPENTSYKSAKKIKKFLNENIRMVNIW